MVRDGAVGEVPAHLRDAHYQGAASVGHGTGYVYPHDDPRGWVPQQYRPDELVGVTLYEPTTHGFEQEVTTRMQRHLSNPIKTTDTIPTTEDAP